VTVQTRYVYRAASPVGTIVDGTEEATSEAAVRQGLVQRGLFPLDVSLAREERRRGGRGGMTLVARAADVAECVATLASLLEAGLPLDRALEIAQRGAARSDVAEALETALRRVREGARLSMSLEDYPRLFPGVAVGLVRAADQGGDLPVALRRLADHLESTVRLRARITSALTYPILLMAAGVVALVVLVFYVLPRFVSLLSDAGSAIPTSTRLLLATSAWLTRLWPVLVVLLLGAAIGWVRWRATPNGRERSDAWLLRLPLVGDLRSEQACARVARSLATLLTGGLPLVPAVEIALEAAGDAAIRADLHEVRDALQRGISLSLALARSPRVPPLMIRLVEVGEETGRLEQLLDRAAAMMEEDLQRRVERLIALVEPALIALFGLVIGFVALALLQAIYGVNTDAF
jgi:type II secretory pathway component PulF